MSQTTRPEAVDVFADHQSTGRGVGPAAVDVFYTDDIEQVDLNKHLLVVFVDDSPPFEPFAFYTEYSNDPIPDHVSPTSALFSRTPTIQALANTGLRLTGMRVAANCSPSRASVHTGMYPFKHGVGTVLDQQSDGDLAEFGDPGYEWPTLIPALEAIDPPVRCGWVGKTHQSVWVDDTFTGPRYAGRSGSGWAIFDRIIGPSTYLFAHMRNLNQTPVPGGGAGTTGGYYSYFYNRTRDNDAKVSVTDGTYATSQQADEVIAFWNTVNAAAGERGFCWWAASATHSPFGSQANPHRDFPPSSIINTQEYIDKAAENQTTTWETLLAMLEGVDTELARVLSTIDQGIRKSMCILVLGDNGTEPSLMNGRAAWGKDYGQKWETMDDQPQGRLKGTMYHWGTWTSAIWSGPEPTRPTMRKAGQITMASTDNVDLYPTIIEYFGGTPPSSQGVSFLPLLWDNAVDHTNHTRQWNFAEHFQRTGNAAAITVGQADELTQGQEYRKRGLWLWITETNIEDGPYLIADGYTPQGRFALVRTLVLGAEVDHVYWHLDAAGVPVDHFEEVDLVNDPAYALHYAALVAKLVEILSGGPPGGDVAWPGELADGTEITFGVDASDQVMIELADGSAATFITDIDSVEGEDAAGAFIDFPLVTTSGSGLWDLLFDRGTSSPLTPFFPLDAAEFLPFELASGAIATFESTHAPTATGAGNGIDIELADGSAAHFDLVLDT